MDVNIDGLKETGSTVRFAKSFVVTAKNELRLVNIPDDFDSAVIRNAVAKIGEVETNLIKADNWISEKANEILRADLKNMLIAMGIPSEQIEKLLGELGEKVKNIMNPIIVPFLNVDEFFDKYGGNEYGVNQGILKKYFSYNNIDGEIYTNEEYTRIENLIMNKYGMSAKDAGMLIMCLDSIGACTFAATANVILAEFKNNPAKFENIFGFPMYRETESGEMVLNQEELLIDLYVHANSGDNQGAYLNINNGKLEIDYNNIGYSDNKGYFLKEDSPMSWSVMYESGDWERDYSITYDFVNDKMEGYNLESEPIGTNHSELADQKNIEEMISKMNDGQQILLTVHGTEENPFPIKILDEIEANIKEGHIMMVTDINNEGLTVATWGMKAFVSFDEIQQFEGTVILDSMNISKNN